MGPRQVRRTLAWFTAIAVVHVALYWGVLRVGFATDDFLWLAEAGRSGSVWDHAVSREPFGYFRPVFHTLTFGLRTCFGLDPVPFHVSALCASTCAALLVATLLRRLTDSGLAVVAGTTLFMVHPANAIVLAWISSLPTLLATVGLLSAVLAWHCYRSSGRVRFALLSLLAHAAALLTKEEAIVCVVWIVAFEVAGRRFGQTTAADRLARAALGVHFLLAAAYLVIWVALRPAGAASMSPDSASDLVRACLDPITRVAALFLPRQLYREPFAHAILVVLAIVIVRATPRGHRASLLAWWTTGTVLAVLALAPSSVFLWDFPFDKMQRLLHPGLPAAALVVAFAADGLHRARSRTMGMVGVVTLAVAALVPFAIRSAKVVSVRQDQCVEARLLFEALRQHEDLLIRLERDGQSLGVIGYPADWVYPVAPIHALAPSLAVRVLDSTHGVDGTVLRWVADRGRFVVVR